MPFFRHTWKVLRAGPGPALVVLIGITFTSVGQVVTIGSAYPILEFMSKGQATGPMIGPIAALIGAAGLRPTIGSFLLVFLASGLAYAVIAACCDVYQKRYVREQEYRIRTALTHGILSADWPYLRGLMHGEAVNIISREADYYKLAVKFGLSAVSCAAQVLALVGFALWLQWRFSLAAFAVFGLGAVYFLPIFHLVNRIGKARVKTANEFTSNLLGALRAAKTIKAGSLDGYAIKTIDPLIEKTARVYYYSGLLEVAQNRGNDALSYVFVASLMFLGYSVFRVDMPALMILMVVFYRLMTPVRGLIDAYSQGSASMPAVDIIEATLRRAKQNPVRRGGAPLKDPIGAVEFRDISYAYPGAKKSIFDKFNFKAVRGQLVLVAGHTGSGKTTFLDLMLGLVRPQTGDVLVNGIALAQLDLASWHRRIGYLSQDSLVFSGTVRSNLLWGRDQEYGDADLRSALQSAQLDSMLKNPQGLDKEIIENGQNLSGGEKQRLCLARILLRKPELLIFDEPTSALDKHTEDQIIEILASLKGEVTAIIVSHQPKFRAFCDQVVEMI